MGHRRKVIERVKAEIDAWRGYPRRIPETHTCPNQPPANAVLPPTSTSPEPRQRNV